MEETDATPEEIFDVFWRTKVHGEEWPNETYAIVCIDENTVKFKNTLLRHAEAHVVEYIDRVLEETRHPNINVTIYLNYTPCGGESNNCSSVLVSKLQEWQRVSMVIYVAGFYHIRRPSCDRANHTNYGCMYDGARSDFLLMLRYGADSRNLRVRAFDRGVWRELANILEYTRDEERYEYDDIRRNEDENMADDLNELIAETMEDVEADAEADRGLDLADTMGNLTL